MLSHGQVFDDSAVAISGSRIQQAKRSHAYAVPSSNNQMIVEADVEQRCRVLDAPTCLHISLARRWIARRVIVDQDHSSGTKLEGGSHHFSGRQGNLGDGAARKKDLAENLVTCIEVKAAQLLGLLTGKFHSQVVEQRTRGGDNRLLKGRLSER